MPRSPRFVLHSFLWVVALGWLFPILWAVFNSFRDYAYTAQHGYVSFGGFTLRNYVNAWTEGEFGVHFWNSLVITAPTVVITLFLSCGMGFVLSRFRFRFNRCCWASFWPPTCCRRSRCSSRSTGCSGTCACRSGSVTRARCSTPRSA